MVSKPEPRLVKLSHSDLLIEYADEDVRGRVVLTVDGDRIGSVDDLLIDKEEQKVRFLEVGSGGFLGIGERKSLIPIEAVSQVDEQRVVVDHSREHVAAAPIYNPHVVQTDPYLNDVYEHYGYPPPWVPGAETK
ncbi:MAG TPA: PRC-barrel domain-containing protein [Thermomicrobiales bacterium]|jgi:sporulation protein YlmC with PRC-barrel domain